MEANTAWMTQLHAKADDRVWLRLWSAYLDEWGCTNIGFDRYGLKVKPNIREKRIRVSLIFEGKVQGVGFRRWVARLAKARKLAGHVKNLDNGSLSVVVAGPIRRVEIFLLIIAEGPQNARVSGISVDDVKISSRNNFSVIR